MAKRKSRLVKARDGVRVTGHPGSKARGRVPGPVHVPNKKLRRDVDVLMLVAAAKVKAQAADAEVERLVLLARRDGVTWERIGEALGVSHQAVQKRWGPYPVKAPRVPRSKKSTVPAGDARPV